MTVETAQQDAQPVAVVVRHAGVIVSQRDFPVGEVLTLGRDRECSVSIADPAASRQHARLQLQSDGVFVIDDSTNGTVVNGELVHRRGQLSRYGVRIDLGRTQVSVGTSASGVSSAPRPDLTKVPEPTAHGAASNPAPQPTPSDRSASQPSVYGPAEELSLLRGEVHRRLTEQLDMTAMTAGEAEDPTLRPRVLSALRRIVSALSDRLPAGMTQEALVGEMADEALGLGPLEALLADRTVTEIMVLDAQHIYVERAGRIVETDLRFTDDQRVRAVIERIVTPLGRRVDESSPLVDARLPDGSRVNVVIRPIALRGSCITIRKFAAKPFDLDALIEHGTLNRAMGRFLLATVQARKNIVISGGTGSGKTTLLNVLSTAIPRGERIVTIEDAAELQLPQPHVVALEARPTNMEGKGEIPIRTLVKNSLRMRPDRIVVGECRGGEALDMLQAMNTGHDGSLTTTHANSPAEAMMRLETLALMAGVGMPQNALRDQIATSLHIIVQQGRFSDGSRKVTAITEVAGLDRDGAYQLRPLFVYTQTGTGSGGEVEGRFGATGYLPSFLPEMLTKGLWSQSEALA